MNIVFRCDASIQIGTGHVMRCLPLADELARQGAKCYFICREHEGNLIDFIAKKGYETYRLEAVSLDSSKKNEAESTLFHSEWLGATQETDAKLVLDIISGIQPNWLVVDHYALDSYLEEKVRPHCNNILVIDDLADREHDCDILLDQNYGRSNRDYINLIPKDCLLLCGPKYSLLRSEFHSLREYSLKRRTNSELKSILINLGGVDKDNFTSKVIASLAKSPLPKDCKITIVAGSTTPWLSNLQNEASKLPWRTQVLCGVENMAELMAECDLAIGAAGSTSWERCCLGVPSILLCIAENQKMVIDSLSNKGIILSIDIDSINSVNINSKIALIKKNLSTYIRLSSEVTDGLGCNRVANKLRSKT